jgi:ATP-binding cassette subfamily B protein
MLARNETETPSADAQMHAVVRRIFSENFHLYRARYALAIACMALVAATTAGSAWIIEKIVNDVFEKRDVQMAMMVGATVLGIFTLKGIAGFGQDVILSRIAANIIARYQKRAFAHMLTLGVGYFTDRRSAYLVSKVNQNIAGVYNMLNQLITVVARDVLSLIGLVFVMIWQDPVMTAGSLLVLPVAGYAIGRYVKRIKTMAQQEIDLAARVGQTMVETAQGIPVVKAFTMEPAIEEKAGALIARAERQSTRIALVNARTRPLTETLGGMAIAGAVAFGGWRVIAQGANPGALLSFLAAAMMAYEPARRLASFRVQFERSLVNARQLFQFLDTRPSQEERPGARELAIARGRIAFRNVGFSYRPGETVLDGISFAAEPGKTTALVGPSGGGKSTIIALLQRFYDPQSGHIAIDGQDIAAAKLASLRGKIAYVSQAPVLFEGSVADNIGYGRPGASREEIVAAARLAQAHEFIADLPAGYDTPVGEMGSNFSGGQRQRLSIARAILRNAPILLLDEATSALDNESEKLVQRALDRLIAGRTTLVVAHRLSTIRNADRILVIDRGRIVETGNHASLIAKPAGLYRKLYELGAMEDRRMDARRGASRGKGTNK